MKIDKDKLQAALEKVKPGLANRELIEQSTSFAFMGDRVVTYNDEISISHPVEGLLNVTGSVKAQLLYAFLGKVKRNEIEMEWENNQVKITAGKSSAGLVFEQEVRLPVEEIGEIGKWKDLPRDFLQALKFCHSCCSRDMSRPILTCVHINGRVIEASDSFQIIRYNLEGKVPASRFLIPASSVRELLKYDVQSISKGEGWVHFKTPDGTVFSSRIFEGEFPDISAHLEFEGTQIEFPKNMIQALERAKVFSQGDSAQDFPTVQVCIGDSLVKISAGDSSGWFKEELTSKYAGSAIQFLINVEFLIHLIEQVQTGIFSNSKIRFAGEKWTHVVATMAPAEK